MMQSCRQDMQDQPKYLPYRGSEIFADSLSSRLLVEGTVPRGYLREDSELYLRQDQQAVAKAAGDTSKVGDERCERIPISDYARNSRSRRGAVQYLLLAVSRHPGRWKGMIVNRGLNAP